MDIMTNESNKRNYDRCKSWHMEIMTHGKHDTWKSWQMDSRTVGNCDRLKSGKIESWYTV